ncbi:hypothetical protein CA13_28370 [Planctomycetes bacterium CA13]|uniref:Transporter suffix domain-containing protein n=1 Tax=Novipirellula herctigrandis TaxID=2527986 RepID=A0A5C5Z2G0_9BACT|nr:hypothetical protein CA13_28370 [Planctomycetes bacterium CA13]
MSDETSQAGWRVRVGIAFFVVSIAWPILIPIFPLMGATTAVTAAFSGSMVIVADLLMIAGAAIAGKEGFALIKAKLFRCLKQFGPAREVGLRRYRIGLILFVVPLAFGWASPYFGQHLPGFVSNPWTYAVACDIMLLSSLMVLGGAFWDKLRSLFRHDAHAVIPDKRAEPVH